MKKQRIINIIIPAVSAVFIVVCSLVSIPLTVPFTLQTFAIFLITALFGAKKATISIAVYILLGLVGLPVFSGFNSGAGTFLGPTGGFMIGFFLIPVSYFVFTKVFSKSALFEIIGLIVGLILCYLTGTVWFLTVYAGAKGNTNILTALSICVIPFIIPDLIKLFLAFVISKRLKPVIAKYN